MRVAIYETDALADRAGEFFALFLIFLAIGTLVLDAYALATLK